MTVSDLLADAKSKRDVALLSLRSVLTNVSSVDASRVFEEKFLFGDGTYDGIISFLDRYMNEGKLLTGRFNQKPGGNLAVQATWDDKLAAACSISGDYVHSGSVAADCIYPPTSTGQPASSPSLGSTWLANNAQADAVLPAGALTTLLAAITTAIGVAAIGTGGKASPDYGSGLRGARTSDNEFSGGLYGNGSPDWPDYYNDGTMPAPDNGNAGNFRTNLINGINAVVTALTAYITFITATRDKLVLIQNGTNTLFVNPNMAADAPLGDIATLNGLITTFGGYLTTMQAHLTYFSAFPALNTLVNGTTYSGVLYQTAAFNTRYITTLPADIATISSSVTTRSGNIPGIIGNTTTGTTPTTSFRKWLVFWVNQLAGKPSSPYVSLDGLSNSSPYSSWSSGQNAESAARAALTSADAALNSMLNDPTKYITKPLLSAAYYNPVVDVTGAVTGRRATLIIQAPIGSNKIRIFKRTIAAGNLTDNTAFSGGEELAWIVTKGANGFILLTYDHTLPSSGAIAYAYRVQAYDTSGSGPAGDLSRLDSFDSSSDQSDVFLGSPFTVTSVLNGLVTTSAPHGVKPGQIVYLNGAVAGFYTARAVSDTQVQLTDATVNSVSTTQLTLTAGIVLLS